MLRNPEDSQLDAIGEDTLLGLTRRIPVDMVVLSVGMKHYRKTVDDLEQMVSAS